MTVPSAASGRLILYNPDLLTREELLRQFVVRTALLDRLVEDVRAADEVGGPHHHLIVGQRGMGKTTLLRRLRYAVAEDPELKTRWLPLTFPEEQYAVDRPADLWLNCLDAVGDAVEGAGKGPEAGEIDDLVDEVRVLPAAQRDRAALEALVGWAARHQTGLLLLLDNVDLILQRLKEDHWDLREALSHERRLVVVGASSAAIEATYTYEEAFYDFFEIHELRGLTLDETWTLITRLGEATGFPAVVQALKGDPGRLETLHLLTGGNPRTLSLLFQVLATHDDGHIRDDVERLLDQATPLYKARMEALPAQGQQVFHALAVGWDPLPAAEVARGAGLSASQASVQLDRLAREGLVEKVGYPPGGTLAYQVAERFFNIWYLMRGSRRVRRRMIWLVEFLKLFYGSEALSARARSLIAGPCEETVTGRTRQAELSLVYGRAVPDRRLADELHYHAIRRLVEARLEGGPLLEEFLDLMGEDRHLAPVVASTEGELLAADARYEEAAAAYARATELDSENRWPWYFLGCVLGHLRRYDDAEAAYRCAISIDPEMALPWIGLGSVLEDLDRYDEAEAAYRYAIELDPAEAVARHLLGRLLNYRLGRHEEAEAAYRQAIELDPEDADPWGALGSLLLHDLGRYEEAEAAYSRAVELAPKEALFWEGLGIARERLRRYEEAEAAYHRAIDLDPEEAQTWHTLGCLLDYELWRPEEAEAAYRRAIELDPQFPPPWNDLGSRLQLSRRYEEAEAAYRRALELNPDLGYAWFNLGTLLHEDLGRHEEAEGAYRRAIALDPEVPCAWSYLGNLLSQDLDRQEEAEAVYRRAAELDPSDADTWYHLGYVLGEELARYDEAEAAYRRAAELCPPDPDAWFRIGDLLHHHSERYDEAGAAYRRAIEVDPSFFWARGALAWMLFVREGNLLEATAHARTAVLLAPSANLRWESTHTLACLLTRAGAWEEAADLARSLLAPEHRDLQEQAWPDVVAFFREAVATGHANDAGTLLDELQLDERWHPLRVALKAAAEGKADPLYRVAPEVRTPAVELLKQIWPEAETVLEAIPRPRGRRRRS